MTAEKKPDLFLYGLILILPFALFYWIMPFVSSRVIGNDYPRYSIQDQMELMFALKTGTWALFVPGFAAGQSAAALTQGQIFHPQAHLAALLPGYWDGLALEWNTFLRLVSLGVAHVLLFAFMRQLRLGRLMGFLLSLIVVYNLRMLDMFRYGAALESYSGFLLLCVSIGWYCLAPTKCRGPLCIIGATCWLACSGHPQMMYYGLLGAALFALVAPYLITYLLDRDKWPLAGVLRFWGLVLIFCVAGLLLSSAYTVPFYFDFLVSSTGRVGEGYTWASEYHDTLMGTVNSFFMPLRSAVSGVFGGSSLILVAALVPLLRLLGVKLPGVVWIIWLIVLITFLHMQGDRLPVHKLVWQYLPLASSFRIAGRISLFLPLFLALLMACVVHAGTVQIKFRGAERSLAANALLASAALLLMGIYLLLPRSVTAATTESATTPMRDLAAWVEPTAFFLGMAALGLFAVQSQSSRLMRAAGLLACLATVAQLAVLLPHGTWIETKQDTPTFDQMRAQKRGGLDYYHKWRRALYSEAIVTQMKWAHIEPFLATVYREHLVVDGNEDALRLINSGRQMNQVVIEQFAGAPSSPGESTAYTGKHDRVTLTYSSFNRLRFAVDAIQPAFLVLGYPHSGNWRAIVDGRPADIYRANVTAHAVRIPEGTSVVEFYYWSNAAVWGMVISCTTLIVVGVIASAQALRRYPRIFAILVVLVFGVSIFMLWSYRLYDGENLDTQYTWQGNRIPDRPNLAFSRHTSMSSIFPWDMPHRCYSGRGVDGDERPKSGFITGMEKQPGWAVDLTQPTPLGGVVFLESRIRPEVNLRPLEVAVSADNISWRIVASIDAPPSGKPLRVVFDDPPLARYLGIRASGICYLTFDEVKVFPPETP